MSAADHDPLATALRRLLLAHSGSVNDLSAKSGVDATVISRLRQTARLPRLNAARKLAVALGLKLVVAPAGEALAPEALVAHLRDHAAAWLGPAVKPMGDPVGMHRMVTPCRGDPHGQPTWRSMLDLTAAAGLSVETGYDWLIRDSAKPVGILRPICAVLAELGHGLTLVSLGSDLVIHPCATPLAGGWKGGG